MNATEEALLRMTINGLQDGKDAEAALDAAVERVMVKLQENGMYEALKAKPLVTARTSSVDLLRWFAGSKDEAEAVVMVLRHASDHLYHYVTPYTASGDFAAIDLLDDIRADMGVL